MQHLILSQFATYCLSNKTFQLIVLVPRSARMAPFSAKITTIMPFGFYNAFATFERLMQRVLDGMPLKASLIYPDDTIIHAESPQ